MPETLRIRFRCFSFVRQVLGTSEIELDLPPGATAADVERSVRLKAGASLEAMSFRIAVNRQIVHESTILQNDDEVALIPPLQGG